MRGILLTVASISCNKGKVGRGDLLCLCHLLGIVVAGGAQLRLQVQLRLRYLAFLPGLATEALTASSSLAEMGEGVPPARSLCEADQGPHELKLRELVARSNDDDACRAGTVLA
ncbi:g11279 [Coccomyxa viridis]|uniref:G11279 protein n=1 Tax=Coccomyxa viridis TaxID=1274662 RepID=A0ABP1G7I7_9CHLO